MKTLSHHADHYELPPIVHKTVFGNESAFPATAENAVAPPFTDEQVDIVAVVLAELRHETEAAIDAALAPLLTRVAVLEAQMATMLTLLDERSLVRGHRDDQKNSGVITMKALRLADRRDLRFAQLLGAQFGFGAGSDCIDQLATQLSEFRREREEQIAALKAEFDRVVEALRAELERAGAWPQERAMLHGEVAQLRGTGSH